MRGILILLLLLSTSSCTRIVAWVVGVDINYDHATIHEITDYALKEGLDTSFVLIFDTTAFRLHNQGKFKPRFQDHWQPANQFKLFDKRGIMISQYGTCEGSRKKFGVLDSFPPKNLNEIFTGYTFDSELAQFRTMDYHNPDSKKFRGYDYKIVLYWNTFSGKVGKALIKDIQGYAQSFRKENILLLYVNDDVLQW